MAVLDARADFARGTAHQRLEGAALRLADAKRRTSDRERGDHLGVLEDRRRAGPDAGRDLVDGNAAAVCAYVFELGAQPRTVAPQRRVALDIAREVRVALA